MDALTLSVIAVLIMIGTEYLHSLRVRRIAALAFGQGRRPGPVASLGPLVRIVSLGLLVWGVVTLYILDPKIHKGEELPDAKKKHLVLILDVSPSMGLEDSGPQKNMTRRQRAAEIMESFFKRVAVDEYKISVVAVYNGAKPVIIDSKDLEVVRYILEELPMYFAFKPGKTRLFSGLEQAAKISRGWNPKSTTIIMVTDGDTVPATGMPRMPSSVRNMLIVGVGDSRAGKFIDGHQSRQDSSTLRSIAVRMNGIYHNGNKNHISSDTISELTRVDARDKVTEFGTRELALIAIGAGASLLALFPILLFYCGSSWRPGVIDSPGEREKYRKKREIEP
ncbi:MAG: VWA domain-containing protein [Planctomycetota bacterium]|nr:VWA domain-containing protein [Planctomycetota bacterium]